MTWQWRQITWRDVAWGAGIAAVLGAATIAFAQTSSTGPASSNTDLWDWTPILTACTAAVVALVGAVNTVQNARIKWRQQQAAADQAAAIAATQLAVLQAEMVARKADAALQVVATQLDGVVIQLDGKLAQRIAEVREAAHAAGILEERTRWERLKKGGTGQ